MSDSTTIDFTRVHPRQYKSQWRFIIDCPSTFNNKAFYYTHYMPKWSRFISQVMSKRLTKTEVRDILPEIRDILPIRTKLADIYAFLQAQDAQLARYLLDCSAVFDAAPHELRSHIVVAFGCRPTALQEFIVARDAENVA